MKTILLTVLALGLMGCATSIEAPPQPDVEEPDCDDGEIENEDGDCVAEPESNEPVESNEGAACHAEADCTPGLWCVITPETGPVTGFCKEVTAS